jgi:hypothetical protein
MKKTNKWYEGNKGLVAGRSKRERSIAGLSNPKEKTVSCLGCGKDTNEYDMLCDDCK